MYEIILMDLDNTILDFESAEKSGIKKIIDSTGLTYHNDMLYAYQKINSTLWQELELGLRSKESVLHSRFESFFSSYGINVDGKEIENLYRLHLNTSYELVPHAVETLSALKQAGKKIYSASNGVFETQMSRLEKSGIMHFFDGHFISDIAGFEKPSPYFFDYCTSHIKDTPLKNMLMVGDSPTSDIAGALGYGIDSCFFAFHKEKTCKEATYSITSLLELLNIVN